MRIQGQILLLLGLVGLVPLIIYGSFAALSARRGAELTVADSAAAVATQVSAQVDAFVRGRLDLVEAAAAVCQEPVASEIRGILSRVVLSDPTLRYLVLFDENGDVLEHTFLPPSGISQRVAGAAADVLSRGVSVATALTIGEDHIPVMAVAAPLDLFGELEGVLVAEVDTLEVWELVRELGLGKSGYAYMLDETGRLIAHGQAEQLARVMAEERDPLPPMVDAAGEISSGGLIYLRPDGVSVLGAASSVPGMNMIAVVELPTAEAFAQARRMGLVLVITLALSLGAVVILSLVGARRVARPIERLAGAASLLGKGRFDVRIEEGRGDEIGDLGRIFNRMAVDLERFSADIRRHERQSFFGRIAGGLAHDLKRPFQHIITHMRTFLAIPTDPRARELVEQALDREQAYVNRLFGDLARFSNDDSLEPQPTSLPELIARVRDALLPAVTSVGATMELRIDEGMCAPVMVDPMAIERALRNLVENAVDVLSHQDGGRIEVRLSRSLGEVRIEVEDSGPGIPEEMLPVLFDAFRTTRRSGTGLGLGLAVVQRIAHAHGGVALASNAPEGGASMCIVLPAEALECPAQQDVGP